MDRFENRQMFNCLIAPWVYIYFNQLDFDLTILSHYRIAVKF